MNVKLNKKRNLSFADALKEAISQAMKLDKNVFIFGQGIDKTAFAYNTTNEIKDKFGSDRIFDSPNSESGQTALAAGAANAGMRPILLHHRVDFMAYTFDQLVNWISLWSFKSAGKGSMPLVIRCVIGRGWGQGPQHAKTLHSMLSYLPGLNVIMPSSPSEAKGLMLSSIFSNDPVIFLEYRHLWNTKEHVPNEHFFIDLKKSRLRKRGKDITIVGAGSSILTVLKSNDALEANKISYDLIDLRNISQLDIGSIIKSCKKTKRLLVVEDGWSNYGFASEIISKVIESGVKLKKPPKRISWESSHVPMSESLEKKYYFDERDVFKACKELIKK